MSQYYLIVSNMHGLALDVEGENRNPGARVIPWQKHGRDNQQFYDDLSTGTIRSKINNLCVDVEQNGLVLKPYQAGDPNQQWERRGTTIVNRFNPGEVLEIAGQDRNPGARIQKYQYNGGPNQNWTFENVGGQPAQPGYPSVQASSYPGAQGYPDYPPGVTVCPPYYPPGSQQTQQPGSYPPGVTVCPPYYPPGNQQTQQPGSYPPGVTVCPPYNPPGSQQTQQPQQRQEFFLVSEMNNKVIDIKGGSRDAGAQIVMWRKNSPISKNQRWYLDGQGFIRSALNDMAFRAERGQACKMVAQANDPHSQWRLDGNKVVNGAGNVLDISRENKDDGAEILAYSHHGKHNQRFRKEP